LQRELILGARLMPLEPKPLRYNPLGEWRPLVAATETDSLRQQIRQESDDEQIQGCLFYMRVSGFHAIEFVAKAGIHLPQQETVFPNGVKLLRLPQPEGLTEANLDYVLYDGWIELPDDQVGSIRVAIEAIAHTMNTLSFAYRVDITWRLKYLLTSHQRGVAQIDEGQLPLLNRLLERDLQPDEQSIVDTCLDWYSRAEHSNSLLNKYLSYWISFEALAVSIAEGKIGGPLSVALTEREVQECIDMYLEQFKTTRKPQAIERAYFDCVRSLRRKTRAAAEVVLGSASPAIKALFDEPIDGYTLESLRHKIAHGDFAEWDYTTESIVRRRLDQLASISREYILRVMTEASPDEPIPDPAKLLALHASLADPRSTTVVSDLGVLPQDDWTIRVAWVE